MAEAVSRFRAGRHLRACAQIQNESGRQISETEESFEGMSGSAEGLPPLEIRGDVDIEVGGLSSLGRIRMANHRNVL